MNKSILGLGTLILWSAALAAQAVELPPSAQTAAEALKKSTRHGEFVKVPVPGSKQEVFTWVVYPERADKAPVVIVIHEIFAMTDWVRGVADQFAKEGFIAVAPDLLSGRGPNGGNTDSIGESGKVTAAVMALKREEVAAMLDAVRDYAIKLPAASGKSATVGYCWGGGASFTYATHQPALDAAVVYYGNPPQADAMAGIKAPVLGLYGQNDARITASVEGTRESMKKLNKAYEVEIYEKAGHGFLRQQNKPGEPNYLAAEKGWQRTLEFIRKHAGK